MHPPPTPSAPAAASLSDAQLLHLAETHLRLGNFALTRTHLLSIQSPHATRLLTLAETLLADSHYSLLCLDLFCSDDKLIRSHFKHLLLILHDLRDGHLGQWAQEAIGRVWKAWEVLGNADRKSRYDQQLREKLAGAGEGGGNLGDDGNHGKGESFWTYCPYCWWLYEYEGVFERCCLRCQNGVCRRTFHGVRVRVPKVLEHGEKGKNGSYQCYGYFPLGDLRAESGGFGSWCPVVGMTSVKRNDGGDGVAQGLSGSDVMGMPENGGGTREKNDHDGGGTRETSNGEDGRKMRETGDGVRMWERNDGEDNGHMRGRNEEEEYVLVCGLERSVTPETWVRKKSVARKTKKMMGRGERF
ncbi:hypothetical protein Droror1_Dr00021916 [Drosera rotundifolia]